MAEAPPISAQFGPFRISARLCSFRYAINSLRLLVRFEHNAWIHFAATLGAIAVGSILRLSLADWRWIGLAVALVWMAEAFNTAIEQLCNRVSPGPDPIVKAVKDMAAGAVLVAATAAALIGAATFLPYLLVASAFGLLR